MKWEFMETREYYEEEFEVTVTFKSKTKTKQVKLNPYSKNKKDRTIARNKARVAKFSCRAK